MKRVLLAPLEWGLGHAARCIALARRLQQEDCELYWAAEGDARALIEAELPGSRFVDLTPGFSMRYSSRNSQVWAVLRAFPRLVYRSWREHRDLGRVIGRYGIDEVISDNRFGLWTKACTCRYMTHQLWIRLPRAWRFLEPFAAALHRSVICRYDSCLVPDYAEEPRSLAGCLSHPRVLPPNVEYIGPLSRFEGLAPTRGGGVLLMVSGPEPQRSLYEQKLLEHYRHASGPVCLVRGSLQAPGLSDETVGSIQVFAMLESRSLAERIAAADCIECRSGYSTLMDLAVAGKLAVARLTPTPGQPEQEYLAEHFQQHVHAVQPQV